MTDTREANEAARRAWDANATFWDARIGTEGNRFFEVLIWPAVERLLLVRPGETVLDVGCGNGVSTRRLAGRARVTGIDFSEEMIRLARSRHVAEGVEYQVLDATDRDALRRLGTGRFDAALCNMALMDMADVSPLMTALPALLKPGGRFVFSILHPCFNNPDAVLVAELQDRAGTLVTTYAVRTARYLTTYTQPGLAIDGQPVPHPYFHRSLETLLGDAFAAGLTLDGLLEPAFPSYMRDPAAPLSWNGNFCELPPVLVGRLVPRGNAVSR